MAKYRPSAIELQGAPDPFLYELRMFRIATDALADPSVQSNPALKNVIIESVLIHARNLHDFFSGNESSNDDMIAGHFVRKPNGTAWKSSKLTFIASCKGDINKALSHLTYTRVKFKPAWDIDRIRQDVEKAYVEFLAFLPVTESPKWQA